MRSFLRNRRFKNFAFKTDVLCSCLLLNSKVVFTQKDKNFKSTTEYSYSGLSITIPKGVSAVLQAEAWYANGKPLGITITNSAEEYNSSTMINQTEKDPCVVTYLHRPDVKDVTYYIWTKYERAADNSVRINSLLFSH